VTLIHVQLLKVEFFRHTIILHKDRLCIGDLDFFELLCDILQQEPLTHTAKDEVRAAMTQFCLGVKLHSQKGTFVQRDDYLASLVKADRLSKALFALLVKNDQ
jgi:hypothetical protein